MTAPAPPRNVSPARTLTELPRSHWPPGLEVRPAAPADLAAISNLMELYRHDLSEYWPYEVDATGRYGYPSLPKYATSPDHLAYAFLHHGVYAGFALVDNSVCVPGNQYWMSQFFVLRRHRRQGLAAAAAQFIFDILPGKWEVGQIPANAPAQAFWRKTIAHYTGGRFIDTVLNNEEWDGPLQTFDNSLAAQAR